MAKKMKKMLAMLLAMVLIIGQLAIPAAATDPNSGGALPPTGSGGDPAPPADLKTTTTPVDGGTQTTNTFTDPATGEKVTIVITQTDDGAGTTQSSTTGEAVLVTGGGAQTDIHKEWETVTTETGSETTGSNPTTTFETDKTTTVTGMESTSETVTNYGSTEHIQVTQRGEEETVIDGTTVTTTTETGKVTGHETVQEPTRTDTTPSTSTTTDTPYTEGTPTNNTEFTYGDLKPGTDQTVTDEDSKTVSVDAEHQGDVTLNLEPDGTWVERTFEITAEELGITNLPEGAVVTPKADGSGYIVTYKEKVETPATPDSTSAPQEGTWTQVGSEQNTYVDPGTYTEGSNTTGDDLSTGDGTSETVTYEKIFDGSGNFLGYKKITVTTTKTTSDTTDEAVGTHTNVTTGTSENTQNGYTMPDKPEESVTDNEFGGKTTVTVTEIPNQGYHVVTEILDADGKLVRKEERNIYGTSHTTQTTVVTDPTAERTTSTTLVTETKTEEIYTIETTRQMEKVDTSTQSFTSTVVSEEDHYEIISVGNNQYFLYKGMMYEVKAITGHGSTTLNGLDPIQKLITDPGNNTDLYDKNKTSDGFYKEYSIDNPNRKYTYANGYEYIVVGNGHASEHGVYRYKDGKLGAISNHQFALRAKDGSVFYVYCADMATDVVAGHSYNVQNVEDAAYYQGSDAAEHIKVACLNGYWGTASGTGSMAAIRNLLRQYGYTEAADKITEGEALSATQAAIWTFGNNDSTRYVRQSNAIEDSTYGEVLYKLLISDALMNATNDKTTDLIDAEDIKSSSITVHGEATDNSGNVLTDDDGHVKYNTTVSFNVSVEKSAFTGNMVVSLTQGGKTVAKIDLATADSNLFGKIFNDGTAGSTDIVFENVVLAEGVVVSLIIDGTQDLEEGVYLYTAKGGYTAAQTFVGVAEGTRDVNLQADVIFEVENPEVKMTKTKTTSLRTDTKDGTRTNTRTDTKQNTRTNTTNEKKTDVTHEIDIISTVTTTETQRDITKEDRKWEAYLEYLLQIVTGEDEDNGDKNRKKKNIILDEEVPLADAPKTGDISGLWAAISAISLAGTAVLSIKRKDEEA